MIDTEEGHQRADRLPRGPRAGAREQSGRQDRRLVSAPAGAPTGRHQRAAPFCVVTLGIWFTPVPAGLATEPARHLFANFAEPSLPVIAELRSRLAHRGRRWRWRPRSSRAHHARQGLRGFERHVLLVIVVFLVARAVVKSGLGRRISLIVVSAFGPSTLGLA